MAEEEEEEEEKPIVFKKIKKGGDGHHGGAWKIALADLMTALMAFFLLMWLLNATPSIVLSNLAEYFAPMSLIPTESAGGKDASSSENAEGNGADSDEEKSVESSTQTQSPSTLAGEGQAAGMFIPAETNNKEDTDSNESSSKPSQEETMELMAMPNIQESGKNSWTSVKAEKQGETKADTKKSSAHSNDHNPEATKLNQPFKGKRMENATKVNIQRNSNKELHALLDKFEQAVMKDSTIRSFSNNIMVNVVPDGLKIDITDSKDINLFEAGQTTITPEAYQLLQKVEKFLDKVPNNFEVIGHTQKFNGDPKSGYNDNWKLSFNRAETVRRVLKDLGIKNGRVTKVSGVAGVDTLPNTTPYDSQNRRITLILKPLGSKSVDKGLQLSKSKEQLKMFNPKDTVRQLQQLVHKKNSGHGQTHENNLSDTIMIPQELVE